MKRMIDKSLDFEIILFPYMHPPPMAARRGTGPDVQKTGSNGHIDGIRLVCFANYHYI